MKKNSPICLLLGVLGVLATSSINAATIAANFNDDTLTTQNIINNATPFVTKNMWWAQQFNSDPSNKTIWTVKIFGHEDAATTTDIESYIHLHICSDDSGKPFPIAGANCKEFPLITTTFQEVLPSSINFQAPGNPTADPNSNLNKHVTFATLSNPFNTVSGQTYWAVLSVDAGATTSSDDFFWRCSCGDNSNCGSATYRGVPAASNVPFAQVSSSDQGTNWSTSSNEPFYLFLSDSKIPEPSTYAAILGLLGFIGVIAVRARRK